MRDAHDAPSANRFFGPIQHVDRAGGVLSGILKQMAAQPGNRRQTPVSESASEMNSCARFTGSARSAYRMDAAIPALR